MFPCTFPILHFNKNLPFVGFSQLVYLYLCASLAEDSPLHTTSAAISVRATLPHALAQPTAGTGWPPSLTRREHQLSNQLARFRTVFIWFPAALTASQTLQKCSSQNEVTCTSYFFLQAKYLL